MAKNIKWIQVDADTQVSTGIANTKAGATNPNLTDLVEQFDWGQYRYGTVADSVYASAAGYKYEAAKAFLSSATANAGLTTEATVRGVTVTVLANKIKTNHEAYITKDAQISGLRGLLYDRIASIGINSTSVATALASNAGIHTNETVTNVGAGITHEVGFYNPSGLSNRFEAL